MKFAIGQYPSWFRGPVLLCHSDTCLILRHLRTAWILLFPSSQDSPLISLPTQGLKDFGREAGNVSFADIDRDNVGEGYGLQSYILLCFLTICRHQYLGILDP